MLRPSRSKKNILEHVSVVNLDPAMMILPFGSNIDIGDTVRYKNVMQEYGLIPNGGILTSLKGDDFCIGTYVILFHYLLIPQRVMDINVGPEWQVITAGSRLMIDTYSEIKTFFLDSFNVSLNKYIIRMSK
jgi:hypothetical protein